MLADDDTTHALTDEEAYHCWTIAACAFRMSGAPPDPMCDVTFNTTRTDNAYTNHIISGATHLPKPSSSTYLSPDDCAMLKDKYGITIDQSTGYNMYAETGPQPAPATVDAEWVYDNGDFKDILGDIYTD